MPTLAKIGASNVDKYVSELALEGKVKTEIIEQWKQRCGELEVLLYKHNIPIPPREGPRRNWNFLAAWRERITRGAKDSSGG